jgi:uncharacterized protein (AIM24 family)
MAKFDIEEEEGMRWIKVTLLDETVRARKRALSHLGGDIAMDSPVPHLRDMLVSCLSDESPWRPRFTGTGELYLESTLGGYHVMELDGSERWIFNNGIYWASEGGIDLSIYRERLITAFWAGEGLLWYQTCARGKGKVVLYTEGPVEERTLQGERIVVTGNYVIARTEGIKFTIRRAAKSLVSHWLSGEKAARCYEGTGTVLLCTTPYWRLKMAAEGTKEAALTT